MYTPRAFKKTLILLSLVSFSFFVAYYFVYRDIREKNEHISSLSQELELETSRQEYLVSTQRTVESLTPDIDAVSGSIVASDGDVSFIESLESVAKGSGLSISIDSLSIDDTAVASDSITALDVRAKMQGSWAGTYGFLAQLESLPWKVQIVRFDFRGDPGDGSVKGAAPVWSTAFEIRVLKYK
jgi:hypothetical protein